VNSESGEANKHEKPDDGANKVTPSQSNTPSITNVPSGNTKTEAANQTEWERRHYWVQVAVFIVGVIVAIIYSCQLSEMRKATHAAKRAGDLARQGMEQVERNARLDQRAWIGISGIKGKPEATKPFNVVIAMTNSGKTPAKRVDMFAVGESTFVWEVEDFATQLQTQAKDRKISNALLPPNGTASNTSQNRRRRHLGF